MSSSGRGWGSWCGSWMGVDGKCVRSWMGYMGNGGWMCWSSREWRKPQTFSVRCFHYFKCISVLYNI